MVEEVAWPAEVYEAGSNGAGEEEAEDNGADEDEVVMRRACDDGGDKEEAVAVNAKTSMNHAMLVLCTVGTSH